MITIIICTYNRPQHLKQALNSLAIQSISKSRFNVIVVDNNSQDDISSIVGEFQNRLDINCVREKKQGLSYARNCGLKEANTKYVAYLDDDSVADKNWIKAMIDIIKNDAPQVFGGPYFPIYESNIKPKWIKDEYYSPNVYRNAPRNLTNEEFISGTNMIYRKFLIEKCGGFNADLGMKGKQSGYGEETELQLRLKKGNVPIRYYPNLKVYHLVPNYKLSLLWILKRQYHSAKVYYKINNIKSRGFIRNIFLLSLFIVKSIIKYPARDKTEFPHWQNYIIIKFSNALGFLA